MRCADFFAGALLAFSIPFAAHAQAPFRCAGYEALEAHPAAAAKILKRERRTLPANGRVRVLVVYAQFAGAAPVPVPAFAAKLFNAQTPGSFTHFYNTMSFNQLQVEGQVLTQRYTASQPAAAYIGRQGEDGRYGEFVTEILAQVDADHDLGRYDDDGLDGLPNSGDDDGYVDYVFVLVPSIPRGFIRGGATGIANLGMPDDYQSADQAADGSAILVSAGGAYGALLEEGNFSRTVGTMAHEFGHALGLPDLYDLLYANSAEDSAGIGHWGLMGWGAHGWNGNDGPNPLSAWSREQLGWIGRDNEQLLLPQQDLSGLEITDMEQGGLAVKVPLQTSILEGGFYHEEYLLLEYRSQTGSFYNRHLPGEGLLVWHVRPLVHMTQEGGFNDREEAKSVDLVCADGLRIDNLDTWAHDAGYTRAHNGNMGDATDPFDGVTYTALEAASLAGTRDSQAAFTAAAIRNIHRTGNAVTADIELSRWSCTIHGEVHWVARCWSTEI